MSELIQLSFDKIMQTRSYTVRGIKCEGKEICDLTLTLA